MHHNFVIGQHHDTEAGSVFGGHPRDEAGKGCVERGDAIGELDSMLKEAFYDLFGFELVGSHAWKYTPIFHEGGDSSAESGTMEMAAVMGRRPWRRPWAGGGACYSPVA